MARTRQGLSPDPESGFSPGAKYGKRGNGKAAPQGGAVAPDSARAGLLEQQFRCPAHLIRSFGPLPDGSCPVKCIGMLHAPVVNESFGGAYFGAAEAKKRGAESIAWRAIRRIACIGRYQERKRDVKLFLII
ncbi:hypothetical protein [Burkholderia metallica]|uniref:hypothetical protein n=1 Tax=Burkholderia metallica TaxID=488729 RepID=UPI00157749B3|nr:hypothetical protein [Burkholderia metallica]